jgi:hypothetical protein
LPKGCGSWRPLARLHDLHPLNGPGETVFPASISGSGAVALTEWSRGSAEPRELPWFGGGPSHRTLTPWPGPRASRPVQSSLRRRRGEGPGPSVVLFPMARHPQGEAETQTGTGVGFAEVV